MGKTKRSFGKEVKLRFSKGEGREGQLRSPVHCVWGFEEEEGGGASKGFSGVRKREEEKRSEKNTAKMGKWWCAFVCRFATSEESWSLARRSGIRQIDGEEEGRRGKSQWGEDERGGQKRKGRDWR